MERITGQRHSRKITEVFRASVKSTIAIQPRFSSGGDDSRISRHSLSSLPGLNRKLEFYVPNKLGS